MDADRDNSTKIQATGFTPDHNLPVDYDQKPKLSQYFYKFSLMLLDSSDPEIQYDISNDVMNVAYNSKYIERNMPTIQIAVTTDDNALYLLSHNYDTVEVVLNLTLIKQITGNKSSIMKFEPTETTVFNGVKLKLVEPVQCRDTVPNKLESKFNKDAQERDKSFILDLVPLGALRNSQVMMNRAYNNVSAGDALAIFGSNNFKTPMYMQVPHIHNIHGNIFVPPMRLNQAVKYLQDKYGIYNNGILFFNDVNRTWIMDPKDRVDENAKYSTVVLESMNDKVPENEANGVHKDDKNTYIRSSIEPVISQDSNMLVNTVGTVMKVMGSSQAQRFFHDVISTGIETKLSSKITYMLNPNSVSKYANDFLRDQSNSQFMMVFKATQFDIRDISLNKLYRLVMFRDSKPAPYSYNLVETKYIFEKVNDSMNIYTIKADMLFNKETE